MKAEDVIYEFGDFRLNVAEKQLCGPDGEPLPLQPKTFELLTVLVENNNRLLSKQELLDRVWADAFVEEGNLKLNIHALRRILGPKLIETVPKHGYRFNGEVRVAENTAPANGPAAPRQRRTRRILIAGAIVAAIGALAFGLIQIRRPAETPTTDRTNAIFKPSKTIAVLPFRNLTKDKQDEFLGIGVADSLITKLGSVGRISVRPTSAVLSFNESATPQIVAERLQVENILEGTIQRIGKRLRFSVQMVQMPNNRVLWARSFEENEGDLLKIQDSISAQIVNSLEINLNKEEQELFARSATDNEQAYQSYLKGRYYWNRRTREDLVKSIEFFKSAVKLDENFALGYAGLAEAFQLFGEYGGMKPSEAFENSRQAAQKALAINPSLAEAHSSLAYTLAFYDWDWPKAEEEFQKAIELNPNYPTAHQWYGEYLLTFGRFDESLSQTQQAQRLDPTSLIISSNTAGVFYFARRFDDCIEQAGKVVAQDDKFVWGHTFLWLCYEAKGDIPKAFESLQKGDSVFLSDEILKEQQSAFEKGGWRELWKFKAEACEKPPLDRLVSDYTRALSWLYAGDKERSFEYLERSFQNRERWFVNLRYHPQWDSVRNDPRFEDFVRRANLNP